MTDGSGGGREGELAVDGLWDSSPGRAVCAALLPNSCPPPAAGRASTVVAHDGWYWQIEEMARGDLVARVSVARRSAAPPQEASIAQVPLSCVVDLVWETAATGPRRGGSQGAPAGRGAWLLTRVGDLRRGIEWDVYSAPGGATWRMAPRYSPEWLREREREVMGRLRGALPLPGADPVQTATQGTPVWLDRLPASLQDQERDRATVTYVSASSAAEPAQPSYVVKLRWRRLSLRPYRSLGFWLVDGIARVRDPS